MITGNYGIGKQIRLGRLFGHPSGRFCSVAVDHFIGYQMGVPEGLRRIKNTLGEIVSAQPDAITMHKGILKSAWSPYAGKIPIILQSIIARPDDSACESLALPEDAIKMGADAFAVAIFVRGETEAAHLRLLADMVRQAEKYDMPVVCHVYPRDMVGMPRISYKPEDIAWGVRCAMEAGADIIKTPYCGDVASYRQIIDDCTVPLIAAGGPKAESLESALGMLGEVVQAGAKGATIGRNIWGFNNIPGAVRAVKAVIHDGSNVIEAMSLLNNN